jgi:hypothetical protein
MTRAERDPSIADGGDQARQSEVQPASHPTARSALRWTGFGIGVLAGAFILTYLVFVPAADWLAQHDVGQVTGSGLETARNNARGSILTLTAGLAGVGALIFTARNFTLQRRIVELSQRTLEESADQARRTLELTEQGQVADRYTRAIDQIGSEQVSVRVGGIYALERIARDSERDHSSWQRCEAWLSACCAWTARRTSPPPTAIIARDPKRTPRLLQAA